MQLEMQIFFHFRTLNDMQIFYFDAFNLKKSVSNKQMWKTG